MTWFVAEIAWSTVSRLRLGPEAQWHAAARQPARSHAGSDGDAQSCMKNEQSMIAGVLLLVHMRYIHGAWQVPSIQNRFESQQK